MLLFIETAALLCHNNYRFLHTNWCLSFILLFFEMHFVNAGDVVRSLFFWPVWQSVCGQNKLEKRKKIKQPSRLKHIGKAAVML